MARLRAAPRLALAYAPPHNQVQASIAANTYVVSGSSETKKLQDLLPGIINQLGPDNLEDLKKIYASYAQVLWTCAHLTIALLRSLLPVRRGNGFVGIII
jgi:hypothetical protein